MKNQLTSPLQGLIGRAASSLQKHTGEVARAQDRITRIGSRATVVLADVSGSMESPAWGGHTKHALLKSAIKQTLQAGHYELIAFAARPMLLTGGAELPPPSGGTALHLGLQAAILRNPGRILLISDGEPDDEHAALAAASRFDGVIDVLYIGSDANSAAMSFLQRLARAGRGHYHGSDIARAGQPSLTHLIQRMLPIA